MVKGIAVDELSERFPRLYHMAQLGSWPSVEKLGLLSTKALLDRLRPPDEERFRIESCHRPQSIVIGPFVFRDQQAMSDRSLRKALPRGLEPADWYREINSRVFFWLSEKRLNTFLNARLYRGQWHDVLVINTMALVEQHQHRILLSPMNSGCTIPFPHKRDLATFQRIADYDYAARRRNPDPIVELAVDYGVPDIRDFVMEVREAKFGEAARVIWKR